MSRTRPVSVTAADGYARTILHLFNHLEEYGWTVEATSDGEECVIFRGDDRFNKAVIVLEKVGGKWTLG